MAVPFSTALFPRRELLFFDRILFLDWSYMMGAARCMDPEPKPEHLADLEWLREQGFLCDLNDVRLPPPKGSEYTAAMRKVRKYGAVWAKYGPANEPQHQPELHKAILLTLDFIARAHAAQANQDPTTRAVALTYSLPDTPPNETPATPVLRLVLPRLPCPAPNVPLREIFAFRGEEETRARIALLRNWIQKKATAFPAASPATQKDWSDEIEAQIAEYQQYMRLQKIKYSTARIEVLLTFAAGVIENLAKLKLKDIVKDAFSIFRTKTDLLEAESKAPGRELSYILYASQRFRPYRRLPLPPPDVNVLSASSG